jgi:hypothetical protein
MSNFHGEKWCSEEVEGSPLGRKMPIVVIQAYKQAGSAPVASRLSQVGTTPAIHWVV